MTLMLLKSIEELFFSNKFEKINLKSYFFQMSLSLGKNDVFFCLD